MNLVSASLSPIPFTLSVSTKTISYRVSTPVWYSDCKILKNITHTSRCVKLNIRR